MTSQAPKSDLTIPKGPSRRRFLTRGVKAGASAGVGATLLGAPAIVRAGPEVVLRFQSTWPTKDIFHEFAQDFAKKVNEMSGGRMRIDMLPANSVVKAFGLLNAVHKGQLDGGHGVAIYWHDRHPAFSLFGSGPGFGMDANYFLAWMEYGGGQKLYDELVQQELNLNVQGFLYGPMTSQPLGWFKKPIRHLSDLKGLKFRAVGLAAELFRELGMQPTAIQASDIVDWLDRGLIDAAEFNNPSSDRALGFPNVSSVCMLRSWHQSAEVFEVLFNKKRFDSLSFELRSIVRYALQASSADMSWKAADRNSRDYEEMGRREGVKFYRTPDDIQVAQLAAWKRVLDRESQKSPIFKKILNSQMLFARRVIGYEIEATPTAQLAYEFWFGKRKQEG